VFLSKGKSPEKPKKILLIEFSEMGAVVLAFRGIYALKERYPDAEVYFWTFEENTGPLFLTGIIPRRNVIAAKGNNLISLFWNLIQTLIAIRKLKIDVVIDLELFARYSSVLSFLSGAPKRIGFYRYKMEGLYRGDLQTHRMIYNPYQHISESYLALIDSIEVKTNEEPLLKVQGSHNTYSLPHVPFSENDFRKASSILKNHNNSKIILINPGYEDKLRLRCWPKKNYVRFMEHFSDSKKWQLVLVGKSPAPDAYVKQFGDCINLTGALSIRELIALFFKASVLLSHDCGMVHLASLTPIHIVALFGPETPLLYSPLSENKKVFFKRLQCSPCFSAYNHRNSVCQDNKCLQEISAQEVIDHLGKFLKSEKPLEEKQEVIF